MTDHAAPGALPTTGVLSTLLVASTGGHLQELVSLRERIEPPARRVEWATHDSEQARSLLRGERVHYLPDVPPRGYAAAARAFPPALRLVRTNRFDRLVSTGAGITIPLVAAALTRGIPCHYIESAARTDGPSLTGRLVAPLPGVLAYTQHPAWSDERWLSRGSLFDGFEPVALQSHRLRRILVLLGTRTGFPFSRAVERLGELLPRVLPADGTIVWQLGESPATGLPGEVYRLMRPEQLVSAVRASDVVIAHAGVGSALMALEQGKCPVLLPRRKRHGEHVDDHQVLIAAELRRRGIAITTDADALSVEDLLRASSTAVERAARPPRFVLA